ncbi:DUF4129 domain-containing protein [Kitasatospora sp. NPDC003701]
MHDGTRPSEPRHDGRSRSADGVRDAVRGRRPGGRLVGALLVLAGLLLAASALRPDGGLLGAPSATVPVRTVGFVLLLALGALIVIGRFAVRYREEVRHLTGPTPWAERLREATAVLLVGAAVAVPVLMFLFHKRVDTGPVDPSPDTPPPPELVTLPPDPSPPPRLGDPASESLLMTVLLVLLGVLAVAVVVALVVAAVLLLWRLRPSRRRPPTALPAAPARSQDALAAAVVTARRALTGDDARAAVIACYAAMEASLAESGLSRRAPDSPTELLERAVADDRVDPVHARVLTALFREARYSTHPMDRTQVNRAQTALDALAERLAARDDLPPEPVAAVGAPDDRTGGRR